MSETTPSTPGMLLIISGPSGVGKTSLVHRVERKLNAVFSVSMTTRPRAAKDAQGNYHFISREAFERHREAGELLEWAQVFDHFYGTPRQPVEASLAAGRVVILEIDVQGAIQVKRNMPEAFAMFLLPPNEQELLKRLRLRKREDESTIQRRFREAKQEMTQARECGVYDLFIVNDSLDQAEAEAVAAVRGELARRGQAGIN